MAVVDRPAEVEAPARRPGPADPPPADGDPLDFDGHPPDAPDLAPVASRPRAWSLRDPVVRDMLALAGVAVILAFLWGRDRGILYWHDEGISIGISSHPLAEIPRLLRQDGSPPLYYGILHVWMRVLGSSEASTHVLSLLFSLGAVVAAWWAGRSLFGRRTGWFLVALAAVNPFLAAYANETRMYSLVVLLSTLFTASFVHVFVFRRRRYLPLCTVALALLMYTHNWALFLAFAGAVALVPCAVFADDRRRLVADAGLCFGAAGVLYLAWIPTLLYQRAHTGAPWAPKPTLLEARAELADLVGGPAAVVAVGLGAGAALVALVRQTRSRTAVALMALAVLPVVALGTAWAISRGSSVWAPRYLGVALPAVILMAAIGLAAGGRVALVAVFVLLFLSAPIDVKTPPERKSNVKTAIQEVSPLLRAGDLVIASDDGMVPILSHYLRPGLRYATTEGLVRDERVSDQRDYVRRLRASRYQSALPPLIEGLPVGGHVLLVIPNHGPPDPGWVEFLRLLLQRSDEVRTMLVGDGRLGLDRAITNANAEDVLNTRVDAFVFTKHAPPGGT